MIGNVEYADMDIEYFVGFHNEMNCWLCFLECPECFAIVPNENTPHNCPESDLKCTEYEQDMLKYILNGVNEFVPISFELFAILMNQQLWTNGNYHIFLYNYIGHQQSKYCLHILSQSA